MNTSALEVYLIGRPQSGKTTAFRALTGSGEGHRRVTHVPDARLDRLAEIARPQKVTPAEIIFCDVFEQRAAELSGRAADRFTTALAEADMLAVTIRCFGDLDADGSPLDPAAALDEVLLELTVADHTTVGRRLERLAGDLRKGLRQQQPEFELMQRCHTQLEAEQPLSGMRLDAEEERMLRGFRFLTLKPMVILANVGEGSLSAGVPAELAHLAAERGLAATAFCAELEAEIAGLDAADQAAFLADYAIAEPARDKVIRACHASLDLISFLTHGPKEVRAWPIVRGTTAAQAAGVIHSDIERGFIRAETIAFADLARLGSEAACKEAGRWRLEGRDYVVQDGDVILFRFNV